MKSFSELPVFATVVSALLGGAAFAQSTSEDGADVVDGATATEIGIVPALNASWEGDVRVADGMTLVGIPDGPILPIAGIAMPSPELQCPIGPGEPTCREAAEAALRELTVGATVHCEQNSSEFDPYFICSVGEFDIASRLVEQGLAIGFFEHHWPLEEDARTNALGMWEAWEQYPSETPDTTFEPPQVMHPGHEAIEACARATSAAWWEKDYNSMATIEAAALFVDELWFRLEMSAGLNFLEEGAPVDDETAQAFKTVENYCNSLNDGLASPTDDPPNFGDMESADAFLSSVADEARETCWQSGVRSAERRDFQHLIELRQIMNFVSFETGRFYGDFWIASQNGNEDTARQALGEALAVFNEAIKRCDSQPSE